MRPASPVAQLVPSELTVVAAKLHRPQPKADWIKRPRLSKQLQQGLHCALMLLSAPAGFGKSTALAQWLAGCPLPAAWLSLDESDNDLFVFLAYLTAAVQRIFPDALTRTAQLRHVVRLPHANHLAACLINDLAELPSDFVLVLDDYHTITNPAIHALVCELVEYAPRNTHLVLSTRCDPPLPIPLLRVRHELLELRAADLRFTREETHAFLTSALGDTLAPQVAQALELHAEGWVAGLRLAVLSLRDARNPDELLAALDGGGARYVMEFLLTEVLARQELAIQNFLLRTSVLDQLQGELCDAVTGNVLDHNGRATLSELEHRNVFLTALDTRGEWYRYHQLFREMLLRELRVRAASDEIAALHRRAGAWYASRGLIDDALKQALAAQDLQGAAELVEQNVHAVLNRDDWRTLERWLNLLPDAFVQTRAGLLLARAWVLHFQNKLAASIPLIAQAHELLSDAALEPARVQELHGEIDTLRAELLFFARQHKVGQQLARRALDTLPAFAHFVSSVALIYLAWHEHAVGQDSLAVQLLKSYLETETAPPEPVVKTRILLGLSIIYARTNEVERGMLAAEQLLQLAESRKLMVAAAWGHYILGYAAYERNQLAQARTHFEMVSAQRYFANARAVCEGLAGLALTYQALGQTTEAAKTLQDLHAFALATEDAERIRFAQGLAARLALERGDLDAAKALYPCLTAPPEVLSDLEPSCLVQVRILLAAGDRQALAEATCSLRELEQFCESTHNQLLLLPVLLLHAVASEAQGKKREALEYLHRAVAIGQARRAVRPFLDFGAPMARLLRELRERGVAKGYIGNLLAAFAAAPSTAASNLDLDAGQYDVLTPREIQVLTLIEQRYSDREIAQTLVISPFTVRAHVNSIYSKLDIHDRRGVAAKARALGLL